MASAAQGGGAAGGVSESKDEDIERREAWPPTTWRTLRDFDSLMTRLWSREITGSRWALGRFACCGCGARLGQWATECQPVCVCGSSLLCDSCMHSPAVLDQTCFACGLWYCSKCDGRVLAEWGSVHCPACFCLTRPTVGHPASVPRDAPCDECREVIRGVPADGCVIVNGYSAQVEHTCIDKLSAADLHRS